MSTDEPKTISHAIDELERIRDDLFCLQKTLEEMEKVGSRKRGSYCGRNIAI